MAYTKADWNRFSVRISSEGYKEAQLLYKLVLRFGTEATGFENLRKKYNNKPFSKYDICDTAVKLLSKQIFAQTARTKKIKVSKLKEMVKPKRKKRK